MGMERSDSVSRFSSRYPLGGTLGTLAGPRRSPLTLPAILGGRRPAMPVGTSSPPTLPATLGGRLAAPLPRDKLTLSAISCAAVSAHADGAFAGSRDADGALAGVRDVPHIALITRWVVGVVVTGGEAGYMDRCVPDMS